MIRLYGLNTSRPGISPIEWYGVTVWRTTMREALDDLRRFSESQREKYEWSAGALGNQNAKIETAMAEVVDPKGGAA